MESAARTLRDSKRFQSSIEWPILVVYEAGTDIKNVLIEASGVFKTVRELVINPCPGEQTWPRPQNWTWQRTVKYLNEKTKSWFWWEWDAIPVEKDWLTQLFDAHRSGKKPLSGPMVINNLGQSYMAGVGFYPGDIGMRANIAIRDLKHPFDIALAEIDGLAKSETVNNIDHLIIHTPLKSNTEFFSAEDVNFEIPNGALLFHKCKDGSLSEVLQGKNRPRATKSSQIPSFTEQTEFDTGYFAFPTSGGDTCYFNSSITRSKGRLLLFTRRNRYFRDHGTGRIFGNAGSTITIWPVRENMSIGWPEKEILMPSRFPKEQWEDPRVYPLGDDLFMSAATWVHGKPWKIRQTFGKLTDDLKAFERLSEPMFGGNSPIPESATDHEKNWIWFNVDGNWFCQYSINPTIVFNTSTMEQFKSKKKHVRWNLGCLRGGTPLIRVKNELIGFFHSSTEWVGGKRRYYMGGYSLKAEPPFPLLRLSEKPILTGSDDDFRLLGSPLVIFPNGVLFENDVWTVVFGVNDEACGWIKIPQSNVDALLTRV